MGFVHNMAENEKYHFQVGLEGEYKHILDTDYENYMIIYFCEQQENSPQTRMFSIYLREDPANVDNGVYNQYLTKLESKIKELGLFEQ